MNKANNMTKYSLRSWVLVLALAPTVMVGILLGSYFTINRFYELEETLIAQGRSIVEPLAIASEFGLVTEDREASKRLLAASQLNNSSLIHSIALFDIDNQLFVTSHYHKDFESMRYTRALESLIASQYETIDDTMVIRVPIISNTGVNQQNNNYTATASPAKHGTSPRLPMLKVSRYLAILRYCLIKKMHCLNNTGQLLQLLSSF